MTGPSLWLDVTETLASGMRTGIQRVTVELARELLGRNLGQLVRLDPWTGTFLTLTDAEVALLFQENAPPKGQSGLKGLLLRWGLVPSLGRLKDAVLFLARPFQPLFRRFDTGQHSKRRVIWNNGVFLTAEVLGNLTRFSAVRRLQKSVPTVLMFHDLFPLTTPAYSALRAGAFARHWELCLGATRLVAVSHFTKDEAVRLAASSRGGLPPVAVCHPGYSLDKALETPPVGGETLGVYFLCVGTLEPRKNQECLVRAYLGYRQKGGKAGLVLAGRPGPGSEPLMKTLEQAADHGVRWYRNASDGDLVWLYRRALALVYPSLAEGFGLPLVEALAQGTPCITSDRTSTAEVAAAYGGCLVVDPEDENALAQALTQFDAPEFRKDLVETIRQDRLPTWESFFTGVDKVCRSCN